MAPARDRTRIQQGDFVQVVNPLRVVRVGYPRTVAEFIPQAREHLQALNLHKQLGFFVDLKDMERALAFQLLHRAGFGGNERSMHKVEVPIYAGEFARVAGIRFCVTGFRDPGYRSYGGESGDSDSEGPSLVEQKRHRLLRLAFRDHKVAFGAHHEDLNGWPELDAADVIQVGDVEAAERIENRLLHRSGDDV